jgi:hypothetical protein
MERQQVYARYFRPDGLAKMSAVFPDLAAMLPEDTPVWRWYLLGRMATTLLSRSMRWLGFSKLHELLQDEAARKSLLCRNRRLFRTLFLSEGMASLDKDSPGMLWTVRLPSEDPEPPVLCMRWTAACRGTVCFSVPNPRISCRLPLSIKTRSVPLRCRRFRLYDPQTGSLILDARDTLCLKTKPSGKARSQRGGPGDQDRSPKAESHGYLPEVDFAAYASKEIDMEVDVEPSYTWRQLLTLVPRGIRKLCRIIRRSVPDD